MREADAAVTGFEGIPHGINESGTAKAICLRLLIGTEAFVFRFIQCNS